MKKKRILAISSSGGHWVQLFRLRPAWDGHCVVYATSTHDLAEVLFSDAKNRGQLTPGYRVLPEANQWQKIRLVWLMLRVFALIAHLRPDFIVTTGAAPGYFALRFGKLFGARTVWVDSLANVAEMSLSGRLAARYADVWLTQWEHLSHPTVGPSFHGSVL